MADQPTTADCPPDEPAAQEFSTLVVLRSYLGVLLLCVAVLAVPFEWVRSAVNQRRCVNELEAMSVDCLYGFEDRPEHGQDWYRDDPQNPFCRGKTATAFGRGMTYYMESPAPIEGSWLSNLVTRDFFRRVVAVRLSQQPRTQRPLRFVAKLGTASTVVLEYIQLNPAILEGLRSVDTLQELELVECGFVETSVGELRAALPNCKITIR